MADTDQRATISRACDACRLRRKRCESLGNPLRSSSSEGCVRCATLRLRCTYDYPSRARGRKKRSAISNAQETPQQDSDESLQPDSRALNTLHQTNFRQNYPLVYLHYPRGAVLHQQPAARPLTSSGNHESRAASSLDSETFNVEFPTDNFCSREMLTLILDDYLRFVYPLVPLVHRPTFILDVQYAHDSTNVDFHSLIMGICAMVVAILPRRFHVYQKCYPPLAFRSRRDMVNQCYDTIMRNRTPEYFDRVNQLKWAIAYSLRIAFYHVGEHNRSRMTDLESTQLARLMGFHDLSEYEGLNCIQTQLRKKAFWMVFYSYAHNQLQCVRSERPSYIDPDMLRAIKLQDLLPVEVDDEMVLEDRYLLQPLTKPCITSGFVVHSRVFWAGLRNTQVSTATSSEDKSCYYCLRQEDPAAEIAHLRERLRELKYMLDDIPSGLRQWVPIRGEQSWHEPHTEEYVLHSQFATLRANLHSTHLWLQSLLLDRLDMAEQKMSSNETSPQLESQSQLAVWNEREELSRQMLHVLNSIPLQYLEPNGLNITEKIRDVAVSLLSCPYPPEDSSARRAKEYVREFSEIIARFDLDPVHTSNTQSWVDTDRTAQVHQSRGTPGTASSSHWT